MDGADPWEPTEIQQEILRQIATGSKGDTVARRLDISGSTLRRHLRVIRRSLGAESTVHAVYIAAKRGLI